MFFSPKFARTISVCNVVSPDVVRESMIDLEAAFWDEDVDERFSTRGVEYHVANEMGAGPPVVAVVGLSRGEDFL